MIAEFNELKRWEMWQGLERAASEGLCTSIGLSNFTATHVNQLYLLQGTIMPSGQPQSIYPCLLVVLFIPHQPLQFTPVCFMSDKFIYRSRYDRIAADRDRQTPTILPSVNQVQANPLCTNQAVATLCQV